MTQLSDKLEFFGFKEGMIQFLDGSVGGMIAVHPMSVESADNDTLNAASGKIKAFLSAVPEETMLQFVVALDHAASTSRAKGGSSAPDLAAELLTARVNWTSELAKQGLLPSKRTLVLFRCPAQSKSTGKGLWQSARARKTAYSSSLSQAWQRAKRTRDILVEELDRLGCAPEVLSDLSVFESLVHFWNPGSLPRSKIVSFSPTRAAVSIINSDLMRDTQGFRIGKVWHRVISLKALPEVTYPSLGARLEELPIGTSLHMSVEFPDQQKEISSLQTQRRVAYSLVAGQRSGVSDLESQAKFHDLEQLLDQLLTEGEKVLRLSLQIVVRDTDRLVLDDKAAEALSLVREIAGAEAMIEDIASLEVFSALSLPNARCKERQHRIKSSNVADLLPLVGTWQGHGANPESVSLRNRRGCLVNVDPFDASLTNANMLISGGSGAGKSYLTSVLMMQLLAKSKTPPKVIFVDVVTYRNSSWQSEFYCGKLRLKGFNPVQVVPWKRLQEFEDSSMATRRVGFCSRA